MENTINPNIPTNQSVSEIVPEVKASNKSLPQLQLLLISLALVVFSIYIGIQIGKRQTPQNNLISIIPTSTPIPTSTIVPTAIPSIIPTMIPSPVITIIPTVIPKTFEQEEMMMRKTLSGFESYIGNGNTAGALTFFTPAQTANAKAKYESIKSKNLGFTLKSWSFVTDNNYLLAVEEIKDGYRVRMNECRTNNTNCSLLYFELVRSNKAENGFQVSRYYDQSYAYQNNLGEEIKYQGFGL